ncbi:MAG TPA: PIN domain-containing protein [Thermoanaerobaculia bacterium]|nr:PIN domain-containing protein [Thermoanaerobaculia bacterium]
MNGTRLFVDSRAWVALFNSRDREHDRASRYWRRLRDERRPLLTSDHVLDETYTLIRRSRAGLPGAMEFHEVVTASRVLEIAEIDGDRRERAWDLFTRYDDKVLSFTDCTSFALLQELGLQEAFAFDSDFARVGFIERP